MTIRVKVFIVIIGAVTTFLVGLLLLSHFAITEGFASLERREANRNIQRLRNAVDSQFDYVAAVTRDWAVWDSAYLWLDGKNPAFPKQSLDNPSAQSMKIDHVIYFHADGRLAGGIAWDFEKNRPTETAKPILDYFSRHPYFSTFKTPKNIKRGFFVLPGFPPAYAVSHPVVKSGFVGPIIGFTIFIKYLNNKEVKRLSEVTELDVAFQLFSEISQSSSWAKALEQRDDQILALEETDADSMRGFTHFMDWEGKDRFVFRIDFARSIMHVGKHSTNIFMVSVLVFGVLITSLLLLLMESSVVGRLQNLSVAVELIGQSKERGVRVDIDGSDEIASLSVCINSMLDAIDQKTRDIEAIIQSVEFGLFRVSAEGRVLGGYSLASTQLLKVDAKTHLEGSYIWDVLDLSQRDAEHFEIVYLQIFEQAFLADFLVENLPKVVLCGGRSLAINPSIVYAEDGSIDSVLFTLSDITRLLAAEAENEKATALLQILKRKEIFLELLRNMTKHASALLVGLGEAQVSDLVIGDTKRMLHTLKGDFACFGLKFIAQEIHEIEDKVHQTEATRFRIKALKESVWHFVNSNRDVLGIKKGEGDLAVTDSELDSFAARILAADSLESVRAEVLGFQTRSQSVQAMKYLGHLLDATRNLSQNLGKQIRVLMAGENIRLPFQYSEVYQTLIHLIRNAADHGIERPEARGDKPIEGTIRLNACMVDGNYEISVEDDGRGIDVNRLGRKAIAMGMIDEIGWDMLTTKERLKYIFKAELSTRDEVTLTSGRGIGLNAVRNAVEKHGGKIRVDSKLGEGTRFTITLPDLSLPLVVLDQSLHDQTAS